MGDLLMKEDSKYFPFGILLYKVTCVSVCVCDSESVCTNPPSVTCNRQKTGTNTLQHVMDGKPELTLYSSYNTDTGNFRPSRFRENTPVRYSSMPRFSSRFLWILHFSILKISNSLPFIININIIQINHLSDYITLSG